MPNQAKKIIEFEALPAQGDLLATAPGEKASGPLPERKSRPKELAKLRQALAEVTAEREDALARLAKLAAEKEEAVAALS
jgi:hypothetical protein